MVGDYGNARIIVRNTSNEYTTGILKMSSTMNATKGIQIRLVLAHGQLESVLLKYCQLIIEQSLVLILGNFINLVNIRSMIDLF